MDGPRVIVVDANPESPLADRLRAHGYEVETALDGATGADRALANPPAAVIADLWMPGVSGIQLCRLLRSEAATADVPVLLRADRDDPRSRFWAERAGAHALLPKGRFGELVRVLAKATEDERSSAPFFLQLSDTTIDIRDRIAQHLDAALFDSVIASEVRALASAGSVDTLFDRLAEFMSRVIGYRWLALSVAGAEPIRRRAPRCAAEIAAEARTALGVHENAPIACIEDEDALDEEGGPPIPPIVRPILLGDRVVGHLALAPTAAIEGGARLVALVARELGGPLCVATLFEETQRLAATDTLTGLFNRRAFVEAVAAPLASGSPVGLLLLDVDKFKLINDRSGHAVGDRVLAALGALLGRELRASDLAARWGGEELVVAFPKADAASAAIAAERLRRAVERLIIVDDEGAPIAVTISGGIAIREDGESLDQLLTRADRAMYAAKNAGRNRIMCAETLTPITMTEELFDPEIDLPIAVPTPLSRVA